jgi:hypothetical protein
MQFADDYSPERIAENERTTDAIRGAASAARDEVIQEEGLHFRMLATSALEILWCMDNGYEAGGKRPRKKGEARTAALLEAGLSIKKQKKAVEPSRTLAMRKDFVSSIDSRDPGGVLRAILLMEDPNGNPDQPFVRTREGLIRAIAKPMTPEQKLRKDARGPVGKALRAGMTCGRISIVLAEVVADVAKVLDKESEARRAKAAKTAKPVNPMGEYMGEHTLAASSGS